MRPLHNQEIYDCLDDDEAFAALPGHIADAVGARSAVFHWRSRDGGPLVLADSGYWSPARMDEYVGKYAEHDIWAQSTLTAQTCNRLWVIDELVPERTYGNSVFYNEWIRLMGDDTYHCAGMSMAGPSGTGLIGLHRAKSSGAFEEDNLARLSQHIGPVQRLMRVRGMLAEARGSNRAMSETLDALPIDAMIVDRDGTLRQANKPARERLSCDGPIRVIKGKLCSRDAGTARAIQTGIDQATDHFCPDSSLVRLILESGNVAIMTIAPIRHGGRRCALLVLRPPLPEDVCQKLQRLFGLTTAEAAIAFFLSQGKSLSEIATVRRVSVQTVRTQLKIVTEKLGCNRQIEVAALIAKI